MEKSVKTTLIGAVTLIIVTLIIVNSINPNSNTITSNGQSEVKVMPDLVSVYFNIETIGLTSKQAEDKSSIISNSLKEKLVINGFNETEIQTISYNIYPNYNWNSATRTITGYTASHMIKIELIVDEKTSDKLGDIVDSATESDALISSINFELSKEKEKEYKKIALNEAAEDSKIKAEAIASGLGKRLGKLVSTSDNNFYYSPYRIYDSSVGEKSLNEATASIQSIQPSEQKISASVTAVFKLK